MGKGGGGGAPQTTTVNTPNPQTANQPQLEQFAGGRLAAAAPWVMSGLRPIDFFSQVQMPQNYFPQMQPGMMAMGQWGQQQPMMQAPSFGQYPPAPQGFGQPLPNPWMMQNPQMAQQAPPQGFMGGV